MNTLDLIKQLRELAAKNGDNMSLKTARDIVNYLVVTNLVDKNPECYGDLLIKIGTPKVC